MLCGQYDRKDTEEKDESVQKKNLKEALYQINLYILIFNIKGELSRMSTCFWYGLDALVNLFIKPLVCIHGHDKESIGWLN